MTEELPRVLIVDDERGMREGVSRLLINRGFETGTAEDGAAALERIKELEYPIVLVDLKMPGMDGFEFLERTRTFEQKIICIIVSAFATIESAVTALRKGVYEFIRKPVKSHELLTRIRNALDYKLLLDERKHAEIALTESELKFRQIFDNLQVGVYILQNEKVVF